MRYIILAFLAAASMIAYVQRQTISLPAKTIQTEFGITDYGMGVVLGAWYWAYAFGQLPAGQIADRIGAIPALLAFGVLWSLLTGAMSLASDFHSLLAIWMCMGIAQAAVFPCATKAIREWFPTTQRAFASGIIVSSQGIGTAIAPIAVAACLKHLSWRETFAAATLPGLMWAVPFVATVVVARFWSSKKAESTEVHDRPKTESVWSAISIAARDFNMHLLCLQQFLRAAAMAFFFTWFPTFIQQVGGLTPEESGRYASGPGAGAMLGGLFGGFASDWILRSTGNKRFARQGLAVIGMALCAACTTLTLFSRDVTVIAGLFTAGAFIGTFGGVSGYSVAIDFGGRRVATVFAIMNMCGNIGAGLFPYAVGWLLQTTGQWHSAILLFSGLFAADAVIWAVFNPRKPLFEESTE
jgi:MFS family permease